MADFDVPEYHLEPREAATRQYEYHKSRWPKELDRDTVWFGITNEPAFLLTPDAVAAGAHRKRVTWNGQEYLDNSEWLAVHALRLAEHALADGVRLSLLGWSPGTPEPWQWTGPEMTRLLTLLRASPDDLALDVHEYSLDATRLEVPSLIGRWQAVPRPWPTVLVTEFGWTLNDAPEAAEGVEQIAAAYRKWYARPEVRGLALWTLGKEGASWGELGRKMNGYLRPLAAAIVATDVPPLAGEPENPPAPPPVTEPANLLVNGSFDDGWTDDDLNPATQQNPKGWLVRWNLTDRSPYSGQPYLLGEGVHKNAFPPDERDEFLWDGPWVYKLFAADRPFWARVKQELTLPAGRYVLSTPVWCDCYRWDRENKRKDYAIEPHHAQILVKVSDRVVSDWRNLQAGRRNEVETVIDHAGGLFDLAVHFRCHWGIGNNLFLNGWSLRRVTAAPPPVEPPPPPPVETPVKVIDISKWQGAIDPARMRAAGVDGVMVRGSYAGVAGSRRDERAVEYVKALQAVGIPVPALYHYFHPKRPWREQYETLAAVMRETGIRRAALDLEETGVVPTTAAEVLAFLRALDEAFPLPDGYRHLVYTSPGYWRDTLKSPGWGAEYELWLAAWTAAATPIVPAPWTRWTVWQYTSDGDGKGHGVESARLDMNRFAGDRAAFGRWAAAGFAPAVAVESKLWAAAQPVEWNPGFALHAAIVRDGWSPIPPERTLADGGKVYHYQRAMKPTASSPMRVYWCEAPNWSRVSVIEDGRAREPKPPEPPPAGSVDMTEYLWSDGRVHVLAYDIGGRQGHQRLTTAAKGGRFYQVKDGEYEELWADETAVYRGVDTSPGEGKYYVQRRDPLSYGAAWCPRRWSPGGVFERNPLVSFYYKADCRKAGEPKEGYHRTWLRFAARYATWTSAGGVTLSDVVELHWLTAPNGAPAERYWYARRTGTQPGGLVGWQSAGGDVSWIVPGGEGQQPPVMEVIACLK